MAWPISLFSGGGSPEQAEGTFQHKADAEVGPQSLSPTIKDLLKHFEEPGVPPPPSARVGDPKLKQRESQPLRVWHLWRYGAFVAMKASEVFAALLSHHIRGPLRKSWGVEMTILTSVMRDVSRHSHLADLTMIRMLMSISGLVPVPSDALVTPVTFCVQRRGLRGILSDFDQCEDGMRELSGEWVVGKRTWQRLQSEWQASRRDGHSSHRSSHSVKRKERVILYLHGGAYYLSNPITHRLITIPLSKSLDARLFAVDYRLAPETRFPGPLHDAVSAYFRLTDDLRIPSENIVVAGDSAGGGLSLALMMYLRDNGYPLPGGGILMSPWVDLTMSCDSWECNAQYDLVPKPLPGDHLNPIACYLGEHMEKYLTHPYASPLFGDFKGLPPLLVQSGDAEVLRDECTLLAHKATLTGVQVRHELYEDAVHVFQTFPFLEQARQAFSSARAWVQEVLKPLDGTAPSKLETKVEESLASEIDTDRAHVVQGDGSESLSKKDELCGLENATEVHVRPVGDTQNEDGFSSQEEEPSWVTPSPWPSPPPSPDEADINRKPEELSRWNTTRSTTSSRSNASVRSRASSTTSNTFWRLPSLAPSTLPTCSPTSSIRRVRSRPYLKIDPTSHPPSKEYRLPAATLSPTFSERAPRPSIRRSHSSHPDITMLCDQWAHYGPANETLTYKPDSLPTRRGKHSGSVSSIISMTTKGKS